MHFINRVYFFIKHYIQQLKRKWILLPLILLFPIIIVGTVILLAVLLIFPNENEPIKVGIVDQDQSTETEAVISLLEESGELGPFIHIESMSEQTAQENITNDNLSAYILFPNQFTNDLYIGKSVQLNIVGNKNRETESHLIKELLDSIMRHIRTSQATILMINEQAKRIGMNDEDRQELIFEQFMTSFLNILGKDQVISEEEVTNYAMTSPVHYFAISTVFVLTFIWLIIIYNSLYTRETTQLYERMSLYGVTHYVQILARIFVTLLLTTIFAFLSIIIVQYFLQFELYKEDIVRISLLLLFNSLIFLQFLAFFEMVISSQRLRLFIQSVLTLIFIFFSGAIIPSIYLPLLIQSFSTYIPSSHSFYWLQEILLNERLYADFNLLIIYVICGFVLLSGLSIVKERVKR